MRDLNALGYLANHVRERKNGNVATYVLNLYLNYSNVCILSCQFCAFARRPHEKEGQFTYDIEEMVRQARAAHAQGITEVHIVGGLHPKLPFSFYLEMIRALKEACPGLCVKAFTAIEIRHLAERIAKKPIRETLEGPARGWAQFPHRRRRGDFRSRRCATRSAAARRARRNGSKSTASGTRWASGAPAPCCMATSRRSPSGSITCAGCGELQDETHGFTALVPFAFEPQHNRLTHLGRVSAFEDLRTLAIARLYLDNFDHITAYWISWACRWRRWPSATAVDDLHGTIQQEKIFHMAGSETPQGQTVAALERAIREAGRIPRQRKHLLPAPRRHRAARHSPTQGVLV